MKARQAKPSAPKKIKLSQCMIVKNEEKNIKRALEWAKDIAFEQIVVDTGSTDKTVEIAKEMGAKVYHFEWIDDFSAAKNYAIEQASGDWIAFLDADEYITKEDAQKVYAVMCKYNDKPEEVLRSSWINLDAEGNITNISVQDRFFKNRNYIRYCNRIHEQIEKIDGKSFKGVDCTELFAIYHTGYTKAAYSETKKAERNIKLLRKEVEENPQNYSAWAYLAESLFVDKQYDEAEKCIEKALSADISKKEIIKNRYDNCRKIYMRCAINSGKSEEEIIRRAKIAGYPNNCNSDIYLFLGLYYLNSNDNVKSYNEFNKFLSAIESLSKKQTDIVDTDINLEKVYTWMTELSRRLNKDDKVVYYGVLALRTNKYLDGVLTAMLMCLSKDTDSAKAAQSTFDFLQKIYDFTNKKDLYLVFKCAKVSNFKSLENKLIPYFSQKELDVLYSDK